MSELKLFENSSFGSVRVVMINDDPWFVAKDVCDCLDLGNSRQAVSYLDDDEKQVLTGDQLSETQSLCNVINNDVAQNADLPDLSSLATSPRGFSVISEFGLYNLVMRSRKPEAHAFRRWVTHDVLPSIRKTGMYAMPDFKDPAAAARAWADAIDREKAERAEKEKAQAALQAEQSAHLDTQYDLLIAQHNLTDLNDKYSASTEMGSVDDMRSAHDMQATLRKYFDVNKKLWEKGFCWHMSGFMCTYCNGGIRITKSRGFEYALPGELHGHYYYMTRRKTEHSDAAVFPKRAWADVIAYFKSHKDSLKDLPCIGYAAR